jgi:UDP-GlcNAc:undecaprenyl-phosphate GlcNAc-1-phosphate transferase
MLIAMMSAFFVSFVVAAILIFTPLSKIALDQPNHRSLHTKVTPRTGGIAIIAGVIAGSLWLQGIYTFLIPTILLLMICLVDDIKGLAVRWRLVAQFVIAAGFLWSAYSMPWWQFLAAVLALVWMINLYNFMDGSDGLAGGMAVFGFGAYGIAAHYQGDIHMTLLAFVVSSSSFAFLLFNFNPARIFMGDSGSVPLGFLAGGIGLHGWLDGLWGLWFPILVFSPFIVDASLTLFRRLMNGEKVWQAHRSHYYQRLIQVGFGHKKTALLEYVLMLFCAAGAIMLLNQPTIIIYVCLFAFVILYAWISFEVQSRWKAFTASLS